MHEHVKFQNVDYTTVSQGDSNSDVSDQRLKIASFRRCNSWPCILVLVISFSQIIILSNTYEDSITRDLADITGTPETPKHLEGKDYVDLIKKEVLKGKFAYAWYLTSYERSQYTCSILVAVDQLRQHGADPKIDFVVADKEEPDKYTKLLQSNGVKVIKVKAPVSQGQNQWKESFTKLWITSFYDYDRIVYMDGDSMPLSNMNQLLQLSPNPIVFAAPSAYWLSKCVKMSGGPNVMDPSPEFFHRYFEDVLTGKSVNGLGGEMDFVNMIKEMPDQVVIDSYATMLIGEFCDKDGIFRYFQNRFNQTADWVIDHGYTVHFIAGWKPWKIDPQKECPGAQPQLFELYARWNDSREKMCQ